MGVLTIQLPNKTYDVVIEPNGYERLSTEYAPLLKTTDRIGIIVDETVHTLYSEQLKRFEQLHNEVHTFVVPKGEACKTLDVYGRAQSFLLQKGFTRNSLLFAFGGGAVGDLTGFIAATFMRGIRFIQLPTTVLAHDSAVGGKTAINMPEGKNMVGAFHQPEAVIFDLNIFKTLPEREWRSGMAELIKHAYISDATWTEQLLQDEQFVQPAFNTLEEQLLKGVAVKAKIVEEDTFEHGSRKFLNFGHTFGHAIEAATNFGTLSHGECVMVGMAYALLLSEKASTLQTGEAKKFIRFAKRQGYSFDSIFEYSFETLYQFMQKDKKASFGTLHFVILEHIGHPNVMTVDESLCREVFEEMRQLIEG